MTGTRTSAVRNAVLATLVGIAGLSSVSSNARADSLNEFLDFNNQQVPAGWNLGFQPGSPGHNVTFANHRYEVGQVDTYAILTKPVSFTSATAALQFSYTANAADDFWGMGNAIHLFDGNGGYYGINGPGHGGYGDPGVRMSIGYGSPSGGRGYPLPNGGVFPADWGTYHVSGMIQNGKVSLKAIKDGATTPIFNGTIAVPELQLSQINKIGLSEIVTSGQSGWIDDVTLKADNLLTPTPVQKPVASPIPAPTSNGPRKGLVYLIHGWNSDPSVWAEQMATDIKAKLGGSESWSVQTCDWSADAAINTTEGPSHIGPGGAASKAITIGKGIAKQIKDLGYTDVHFISHSAGAWMADSATDWLKANSGIKVQETFLDAYALGSEPSLGDTADFAEQYVDHRIGLGAGAFTNATLANAYNVDVTATDPDYTLNPISQHGWPAKWYDNTVKNFSAGNLPSFGYTLALESGRENLPSHTAFHRGDRVSLPLNAPETVIVPSYTAGSTPAAMFEVPFIKSDTGTIQDLGNGSLKMLSGSPVWISSMIPVTDPSNAVAFDLEFQTTTPGYFVAYLDGISIYEADAESIGLGLQHIVLPFEAYLSLGNHNLAFRLDPLTDAQSIVGISNVTFGVVPEPTGVSLLALGWFLTGVRRRRLGHLN